MTSGQNSAGAPSLIAMITAGVLMAHQVGAKAARDAIFLSTYDATDLPPMVAGAAAASILIAVLASRVLGRHAPSRVVPWGFVLSAALQIGEWRLLAVNPNIAAVLIYLHFVAFTAVLLSGFWSVTNETIDPHTAKRRFGHIAAFGTLGGFAGGLAAASMRTGNVLVWLAALHALGAAAIFLLRAVSKKGMPARRPVEPAANARQAFSRAPYLFSLAALVLVGTSSAAAVDWVFKAQAAAHHADRQGLLQFFGLYHSAVQLLSLIVQTFATRFFLQKFGVGKTVASLPATLSAASLAAVFFPALPVITVLRGSESVLRSSLFRSGYELFYTPIPVSDKRPAKSIIDVGVDRLGDAFGAGITTVFIRLGVSEAPVRLLLVAAGLSAAGVWVARRLDRGYVRALETSLVDRALDVDTSLPGTAASVLHTPGEMPAIARPAAPSPAAASMPVPAGSATPEAPRSLRRPLEPAVQRLSDLRSGSARRVRAALRRSDPLDPVLVPQVITLLAWDEVSDEAREALVKSAPRICGQLVDFLLDPNQDFAIRRRIPRVLAACAAQRAADGLTAALSDSRFEVRFQSGRALSVVLESNPDVTVNPAAMFEAVDRELSVSRSVWDGHRLLDRRDPSEQTQFLDEVLRDRANASLEHVFTLLALVLPREPLMVAFRALHTQDPALRGLALEYLETVLPDSIREKLSHIAERPAAAGKRTGDEILASLMQSNESVVTLLRDRLRRDPE